MASKVYYNGACPVSNAGKVDKRGVFWVNTTSYCVASLQVSRMQTSRLQYLRQLLIRLSFDERIKGDHHIFTREGVVEEILSLQPKGSMAKPYQVKQVRNVIVRYKLGPEDVG